MTLYDLHVKFNHCSKERLNILRRKLEQDDDIDIIEEDFHCDDCQEAGFQRLPHYPNPPEHFDQFEKGTYLTHDLSGKISIEPLHMEESKYISQVIDVKSGYESLRLLETKNEAVDHIQHVVEVMKNRYDIKVKQVKTDHASETYQSQNYRNFLHENGIRLLGTSLMAHQTNPQSERQMKEIAKVTRSLLTHANLPTEFWGYAVFHASQIKNYLPTKANHINRNNPPIIEFEGENAWKQIKNFTQGVFGCDCIAIKPVEHRKKFENPATKCIFLGFNEDNQDYFLLNVNTKQLFQSRNVKFYSSNFTYATLIPDEDVYLYGKRYNQRNGETEIFVQFTEDDDMEPIVRNKDTQVDYNTLENDIISNFTQEFDVSNTEINEPSSSTANNLNMQQLPDITEEDIIGAFKTKIDKLEDPELQRKILQLCSILFQKLEEKGREEFGEDHKDGIFEKEIKNLNKQNGKENVTSMRPANHNDPDRITLNQFNLSGERQDQDIKTKTNNFLNENNEPLSYDYKKIDRDLKEWNEKLPIWDDLLRQIDNELHKSDKTILEKEFNKFFKTKTNARGKVKTNRGWKPKSLEDCYLNGDEGWKKAADKEINGLIEDEVFELVDKSELKEGIKPIRLLNIFNIKEDNTKKMRTCVKGDDRLEEDIGDSRASVIFKTPLKMVMVIAAIQRLSMQYYDYVGAFRTTPVNEKMKPVYLWIPKGWPGVSQEEHRTKVFRLKKVLYGVQEATREFQLQHEKLLKKLNLIQSEVDNCVFYHKRKNGQYLFVLTHVDDNLVLAEEKEGKNLINEIEKFYKITFGPVDVYVGWRIWSNHDKSEIYYNQENFVDSILDKYGEMKEKLVNLPAPTNEDWNIINDDDEKVLLEVPYQSLLASMNYLINTIPEILTSINKLSSFSNDPRRKHWNALKRVWDYTRQHKREYIKIDGNIRQEFKIGTRKILEAYADSAMGNEVKDRTRIGGVFMFYGNLIGHFSKTIKKSKPTSMAEGETYALVEASNGLLYAAQFLKSIEYDFKEPSMIYGDNKASIIISSSEKFLEKSKYFKLKVANLKQAINQERIIIKWIKSEENVADIFTKILGGEKFDKFKRVLKNN